MDVEQTFLFIIEVVGTVAFAISGIRMAAAKHFDWFGAYVVGLVTAIGGGTVRDLLLNIPVFWMQTWWYIAVTGLSLIVVIVFRRILVKTRVLFLFDTIGLALFVVIGIQKTLAVDYPFWVAVIMGITTGALGGVLRDILVNNEPLLFQKDIYATACLAGGLVYWVAYYCGLSMPAQGIACAVTVIAMRLLAVRYSWSLPVLVDIDENTGNKV
ncbi:trimeric intracellular cation channel family protein [Muribaculum gordoncarteri]|uniref:Trimeric intracellular cation channel family protein n=2 Tax=Muribaculum TaxID=1918540 RepID=A0A4P7VDX9_9BACT|nr:trimeric intracellular cation channel family protein [Muribaculum gordoncarteri]QCD35063.1 trimeric intracellular cation channel family protein [Muribaculum gordoncarteri]